MQANQFLGAHMSIAQGIDKAIDRIQKVKGTALQFFSKNQRQWKYKPLSSQKIQLFKDKYKSWGPYPIIIHTSYLLNLASPDLDQYTKSIQDLKAELKRATLLGVHYVVTHPGSHKGAGLNQGLNKLKQAIKKVFSTVPEFKGWLLLENTCGAGNLLGGNLEEYQAIKQELFDLKVGFCLDTAHLFGFGYDFRTSNDYQRLKQILDKTLGLEKVKLWHLNDSLEDLGSKKDRHYHIGQGKIGLNGFKFILQDPDFACLPKIIETPKENNWDQKNLTTLRKLCPKK